MKEIHGRERDLEIKNKKGLLHLAFYAFAAPRFFYPDFDTPLAKVRKIW